MALINCMECGKPVSDTAKKCPQCGVDAPALSEQQKAEIIEKYKRGAHGRIGGWAFLSGCGWMFFLIVTNSEKSSIVDAWGFAKYLIIGGALAYIVSEVERNLAERKSKKAK